MQPYFNDWWQWEGVCLALSEGVRSGRQALPKGKRAVTVGPRAQCLSQVLELGMWEPQSLPTCHMAAGRWHQPHRRRGACTQEAMGCEGPQAEDPGIQEEVVRSGQGGLPKMRIFNWHLACGIHSLSHYTNGTQMLWGDIRELTNFMPLFSNSLQSYLFLCVFLGGVTF